MGVQTQGSHSYPLVAIDLSNILSRRLFTSSSARFCLEHASSVDEQDPCHLPDSVSDVLASRIGLNIAKLGLLTILRVLVGLSDSFCDYLCCALEFAAG